MKKPKVVIVMPAYNPNYAHDQRSECWSHSVDAGLVLGSQFDLSA
jgi:hypothetical protein